MQMLDNSRDSVPVFRCYVTEIDSLGLGRM